MPENDITELQTLDIYQLTEAQYAELLESSEFDPDALYMTPAEDPLSTLISLIYPVGAVYQNTTNVNPGTFMTGTTWQLISSVALASEHITGNGYALAVGNSAYPGSLVKTSSGIVSNQILGQQKGVSASNNGYSTSVTVGVPTASELGNHLEYSGLIADTITVYTWERTA